MSMTKLILVGLLLLLSFCFGKEYEKNKINKKAIRINDVPYGSDKKSREVMQIVLNDDLSDLVSCGQSSVETKQLPGKIIVKITF